jgi:Ser/Thr protein kinase RdoA (MazF antagonist)
MERAQRRTKADISIECRDLLSAKAARSPSYGDIVAHLDDYLRRLLRCLDIRPCGACVLESETTVAVRVWGVEGTYLIKISPTRGDLFVSDYFYARLAEWGLSVPRVLLHDDTATLIPYEAQVLTWLDGVDLRGVPQALHRPAGTLVGRFLRTLHQIPADGFGTPYPIGGWSVSSWLDALRHDYRYRHDVAHAVFTPAQVDVIEAATFDNARLAIGRPHLIHADVNPANVLFRTEGDTVHLVALIDPGPIVGGDPLFDLAGATNDRDAFGSGVWDGYTEGAPLAHDEEYRYRQLLLLSYYWTACWQYDTGHDYRERKAWALQLSAANTRD